MDGIEVRSWFMSEGRGPKKLSLRALKSPDIFCIILFSIYYSAQKVCCFEEQLVQYLNVLHFLIDSIYVMVGGIKKIDVSRFSAYRNPVSNREGKKLEMHAENRYP